MHKSNHFKYFIGIDISKKTLDITVLEGKQSLFYSQIENTEKGIRSFLLELKKQGVVPDECLFCAEYTGIYNVPLQNVLTKKELYLWVEKAIQIKRTLGMERGKNDKVDSYRIAMYAFKNRDESKQWKPMREQLTSLKKLVSLRRRLINMKKQITQTFTEGEFLTRQELKILKASCKKTIEALRKDIIEIEKRMNLLIKEDQELSRLYLLITSVDGIGMHTAIEIIITTNEFKNITEAKKFSCYAGVVPFEYSSGTSLNKKARVSKMANTSVKTLLHMSALSVINMEGDMQNYFLRKLSEGKNKMSIINAIRNKLVLRVFACVKNDRLYEKKYQYPFVNP